MLYRSTQLVVSILLALLLGFSSSGFSSEEDWVDDDAPPMREATAEDLGITPEEMEALASGESLTNAGSSYDSTLLSKYIPGVAFIPLDEPDGGPDDDAFERINGSCIRPDPDSNGNNSIGYASIELPANALLVDVFVHVFDDDATENITVSIVRVDMDVETTFMLPGPVIDTTWGLGTNGTLVSGSSSGTPGWTAYVLDPTDIIAGFEPTILAPVGTGSHRFFAAVVNLKNAAGADHKLCGLRVRYRVPASGDNQAFTPLTPCKFFDSRPPDGTGKFSANEIRTINVSGDTSAQGGEGNCGVPFSATAVQTNIVVIDPNGTGSLKLWAPSDPEPAGLVAFFASPAFWNGSGVVPLSSSGGTKNMNVKTNFQGAHVFLNVTGYYSPVSNMGN